MSYNDTKSIILTVCLFGLIVSVIVFVSLIDTQSFKKEAIANNAAHYNATNGNFEWNK